MKASITIFIFLIFTACNKSTSESNERDIKNILAGTYWASDFYHYHNCYTFLTDSSGTSKDGQFAWRVPIDSSLITHSDSILYSDEIPFRYTLIDSVLTINYDQKESDRIFYQKNNKDRIFFVSDYEYAYGKEILNLSTIPKHP
jgi:hypothetical protein